MDSGPESWYLTVEEGVSVTWEIEVSQPRYHSLGSQEADPEMKIGMQIFLFKKSTPVEGEEGSRTEQREKLSCDASLTDASANHKASYGDGRGLQRSFSHRVNHYMQDRCEGEVIWVRQSPSAEAAPKGS